MSLPLAIKLTFDQRTYDRALSCVHCGLCLPACPTYVSTLHEADSPRGRIRLLRGLAEGAVPATDGVLRHLDLCLDCRACETACPSGVIYHELIEESRHRMAAASAARQTFQQRLLRWVLLNVLVHPGRLRFALLPVRLMQKLGIHRFVRASGATRLLPGAWRKLESLLPGDGPMWPRPLPPLIGHADSFLSAIQGLGLRTRPRKAVVGFFGGCVGSVLADRINRQAAELLSAAGADVLSPRRQACCGAVHHHNSDPRGARTAMRFARRNVDLFLSAGGGPVDWIVTPIGGCGAMLREYDHLLRDDRRYAARAAEFAGKVRDICELLDELGGLQMRHPVPVAATYHDACHLAHGQKVTAAPRRLLGRIPGLKLIDLPESDMCCGAGGTYNLTQPEMASQLGQRKLDRILATGASVCLTGNIGCAMQIRSEANARGLTLRVMHPIELVHRSVFG